MGWWPFSGSTEAPAPEPKLDEFVPPPPVGNYLAPPPSAPSKKNALTSQPFSGFSAPPPISDMPASQYSSFTPPGAIEGSDYSEDFSKYASNIRESSGIDDAYYASANPSQPFITNPRLRGCIENMKMGVKMGGLVGGIFGALTGCYASVVHRNLLILPATIIGGGISFGFFLGCGMIVRCEPPKKQ